MNYLTTAEAAERWGVARQTVLKWIARGKLPSATKAGRDWLIPAATPKPKPIERRTTKKEPE